MSCKYFILTKPNNKDISHNNENQIVFLNNSKTYILPQVNIEYYMKYGLFESNLIDWTRQFCNKEKIFLDIGAHSGTYSICLADSCRHVYSFEPQKMTYYSLCGSVALSNINNITCINIGLGSPEQIGTQTLNIVSNDGGGSSLFVNNTTVLTTETIQINTLDSFNLENIGFIKMDVEDNELFVLKGALITLKQSNYPIILFESNNSNTELFSFLKNINYKIQQINGYSNMFLASV
jgi:FkbM family methyltransferase